MCRNKRLITIFGRYATSALQIQKWKHLLQFAHTSAQIQANLLGYTVCVYCLYCHSVSVFKLVPFFPIKIIKQQENNSFGVFSPKWQAVSLLRKISKTEIYKEQAFELCTINFLIGVFIDLASPLYCLAAILAAINRIFLLAYVYSQAVRQLVIE